MDGPPRARRTPSTDPARHTNSGGTKGKTYFMCAYSARRRRAGRRLTRAALRGQGDRGDRGEPTSRPRWPREKREKKIKARRCGRPRRPGTGRTARGCRRSPRIPTGRCGTGRTSCLVRFTRLASKARTTAILVGATTGRRTSASKTGRLLPRRGTGGGVFHTDRWCGA